MSPLTLSSSVTFVLEEETKDVPFVVSVTAGLTTHNFQFATHFLLSIKLKLHETKIYRPKTLGTLHVFSSIHSEQANASANPLIQFVGRNAFLNTKHLRKTAL